MFEYDISAWNMTYQRSAETVYAPESTLEMITELRGLKVAPLCYDVTYATWRCMFTKLNSLFDYFPLYRQYL